MKDYKMAYDSVRFESVRQHEIVLMSIHLTFMDEIKKGLIVISSEKNDMSELNIITIELSEKMNMMRVKNITDAINTTAYYAVHPELLGEQYEIASKS